MENLVWALAAAAVGFLIAWLLGFVLIPFMRKIHFGQTILDIGPAWHKSKQGTPVMGGIMFIVAITVSGGIFSASQFQRDSRGVLILVTALLFAFIGFMDDYAKVTKKQNLGLRAWQKLFLQLLVAVAMLYTLQLLGYLDTNLYIPFIKKNLDLGIFYYPLATVLVVGLNNAVNLTDGVDGLASCVTLPIMIFFSAAASFMGSTAIQMVAAAAAGGLIGFLVWNFHPAKIFMGDTGSLYLGGLVTAMGMSLRIEILMILVSVIYLTEVVSDILQVVYFKATHGKRLFKMAPIHHHFEKCGWSEVKIVFVFGAITILFCLIAYLGL